MNCILDPRLQCIYCRFTLSIQIIEQLKYSVLQMVCDRQIDFFFDMNIQ